MAEVVFTNTRYVVILVRLGLAIALLISTVSVTVSWTSMLCVACLALTFIITRYEESSMWCSKLYFRVIKSDNPFKGKIAPGYLSAAKESEIAKEIAEFVLYDANSVASVSNFNMIKNNTECMFARQSKIWGSSDYDDSLSLEENMRRLIPTFYKFTMTFEDFGLDAFVIELPGKLYGENIQVFGKAVRAVLLTMCQSDVWRQKQALLNNPQKYDDALKIYLRSLVVDTTTWSRRSWVFQFNQITFFITTFAPFYPETNSRYAFGCENCYILFQPEISFAIRDLPSDTAETNWIHPITVRDKIRVAFRDAGREYGAPLKHRKPMVYEILKPVHPDDESTSWWLHQ